MNEELNSGEASGEWKKDYTQLQKHLKGEGNLSVDELTYLFADVYLRAAPENVAKRGKKPSKEILKLYSKYQKGTN